MCDVPRRLYSESDNSIFVEPSKAFRIIYAARRQTSPGARPPGTEPIARAAGVLNVNLIRDLEEQARQSKSIACISALCLTMETLGVQASLSKRLVRMARCSYGIKLELDLRGTLRSFLGPRGIQEPTRRVRELGTLRDGRKVFVTGRCDALVRASPLSGIGGDTESAVPVEIKSRTRVDRLGGVLRTGEILRSFRSEWSEYGDGWGSEEKEAGGRSASSGAGDATQSLLYMWLYRSQRLLYVQCARIGQNDPIVPIIAEIPWDAGAFERLRSEIIRNLEPAREPAAPEDRARPIRATKELSRTTGAPESQCAQKGAEARKRAPKRGSAPSTKRVYRTRLLDKCGSILVGAGLATRLNRKRSIADIASSTVFKSRARTRRQRRAVLRAAKMYGRQLRALGF